MSVNHIDSNLLKRMFISGANNLELHKQWINELNVFPVPDGDTGTNMSMTVSSAVKEIKNITDGDMNALLKAIEHGSLRGARGNSGVILSQLLRGFTKEVRRHDSDITTKILVAAIEKSVETAYKAVMKPKEGTILTVARGIEKKAIVLSKEGVGLQEMLEKLIAEGDRVLERTPDMLPVLKEAGVVDSGGQGLMVILHGAYSAFNGEDIVVNEKDSEDEQTEKNITVVNRPLEAPTYGYCTEFIVNTEKEPSQQEMTDLSEFLQSIGDSVVLVYDAGMIKIHVHTNNPGKVIERALLFGELANIKIDNMREEHRAMLALNPDNSNVEVSQEDKSDEIANDTKPADMKKYGFIEVSVGVGFKQIFDDMQVDVVINGGQTMNPSTEDFMEAIAAVNAENIFVFPNNSNIIMAANQARDLTEDKNIIVIPTKTVTQGITALVNFDSAADTDDNIATMTDAAQGVATAQITYAIRDTSIDDFDIKTGDIMAVGDKALLAVGQSVSEVAIKSVKAIADDTTELISVYYGEEFEESEVSKLEAMLTEEFPSSAVDVVYGGQPVYFCIISAE